MKIIIATLLLIAAFVVASDETYFLQPAISASLIEDINNDPTSTWQAGPNELFKDMTLAEVKSKLLGARAINLIPGNYAAPLKTSYPLVDIPAQFDSRTQWPTCIHPIRNQARCGSCWAFAASEVLSDRFCIASKGAVNPILSPQYIVACDTSDYGCQGGYLANSWQFIQQTGLPLDSCVAYTAGGGDSGTCKTECDDGSALKLFKAADVSTPATVEQIQNEIMTNGPVEVAFSVYRDFITYKSGVYSHKSGGLLGGHAVKAIGWGVENNTPYWLIANSWDVVWGDKGLFKIKRGSNECGIESNVITGTAAL